MGVNRITVSVQTERQKRCIRFVNRDLWSAQCFKGDAWKKVTFSSDANRAELSVVPRAETDRMKVHRQTVSNGGS